MKEQRVIVSIGSYYEVIILITVTVLILGWCWCIWINKKQGVGSFNVGNLAYAASYAWLIYRNVTHYAAHPRAVEATFIHETMGITIMQAAAVTWFIATYYWNRSIKNRWGGERELGAFNAEIDSTYKPKTQNKR
jgi:hypothetical protein